MISLQQAQRELQQAAAMNPGPWIAHSQSVAENARLIAQRAGMDEQRGKMTWPSLVGVEAAQKKSRELWTQAEEALAVFGDSAWFLREFVEALAKRKK